MKYLANELQCMPDEVEAKLAELSTEELRVLFDKYNDRYAKVFHDKIEATNEGGLVSAATYDADLDDAKECIGAIRVKGGFF